VDGDELSDDSDAPSDDDDDNDINSAEHGVWHQSSRNSGPNGHRPIDLRPPEKLLRKAERKAARYIENKKVNCTVFFIYCV